MSSLKEQKRRDKNTVIIESHPIQSKNNNHVEIERYYRNRAEVNNKEKYILFILFKLKYE
jgi:hypothetical protein